MAKSRNQKAKILVLERLVKQTDEEHAVTMQKILETLKEYGIHAERKSIYDDFEALRDFGYDIQLKRGKPGGYYLKDGSAASLKETPEKTKKEPEPEKTVRDGKYSRDEVLKDSGKKLRLLCGKSREQEVRAYFGDAAEYKEKEPGFLTVSAPPLSGPAFFGWLTAMGRDVRIQKPRRAAVSYREYLKVLAKDYKGI